jgi:hypothetical protein
MDDSLRTKALRAYRSGSSLQFTPGRNIERYYDVTYVLILAERLPEREIRALRLATQTREDGLRAARGGDLEEAAALIARARDVYSRENLSKEAVVCAETYQGAAESYLHYKREDHAAAMRSAMDSLRLCEAMVLEYGYPGELRRVHLARNIARVHAQAGNKRAALRISAQLLQYLGGAEGAWPLPYDGPTRRSHLDDDDAEMVLDQILSEAVRLLEPEEQVAREYLPAVDTARQLLGASDQAVLRRAAHCLAACIACVQGNDEGFYDSAGTFFEAGKQSLEFSWRELERKLRRAAGEHAVGPVIDDAKK